MPNSGVDVRHLRAIIASIQLTRVLRGMNKTCSYFLNLNNFTICALEGNVQLPQIKTSVILSSLLMM